MDGYVNCSYLKSKGFLLNVQVVGVRTQSLVVVRMVERQPQAKVSLVHVWHHSMAAVLMVYLRLWVNTLKAALTYPSALEVNNTEIKNL